MPLHNLNVIVPVSGEGGNEPQPASIVKCIASDAPDPTDQLHNELRTKRLRISEVHAVSACDRGGPEGAVKTSSASLPGFCGFMGVTQTAADGWAQLHRSPITAMLSFFVPHCTTLGVLLILVTGVDFMRLHITIPLCLAAVLNAQQNATVWVLGPLICKSRLHKASVYLLLALIAVAAVLAFLEPPAEKVPMDSSLFSTGLIVLAAFCMCVSLKSGLSESELPAEPRTSVLKPIAQSGINTLRVIDSLTDLSFMIVLLVLCALADLMVAVCMIVMGSENVNRKRKRLLLRLHIAALVFELGVIGVTLLSLMSAAKRPQEEQDPEKAAGNGEQILVVLVSLGTTALTFTLTMVGAGSALVGLKRVASRVSVSRRSAVSFSRQYRGRAAGYEGSSGGSCIMEPCSKPAKAPVEVPGLLLHEEEVGATL